jgi:hypothetical protein
VGIAQVRYRLSSCCNCTFVLNASLSLFVYTQRVPAGRSRSSRFRVNSAVPSHGHDGGGGGGSSSSSSDEGSHPPGGPFRRTPSRTPSRSSSRSSPYSHDDEDEDRQSSRSSHSFGPLGDETNDTETAAKYLNMPPSEGPHSPQHLRLWENVRGTGLFE